MNYRTEPMSSLSSQKSKLLNVQRGVQGGGQARTDADNIIQQDGDQGGFGA